MENYKMKACMIDISRFRVPVLERMKEMIKNVAETGYNTVFFNIEHSFKIPGRDMIGFEADGFTTEEMKGIVLYAEDKGISIIPLIQSFGHMFHILKWEDYSHLAETEKKWSVSVSDQTYQLIDDLYCAASRVFNSDHIHIGGDEVYDMAQGKSSHLLEHGSRSGIFLNHILKLQNIASKYGKKIILWGDMIDKDPEVMNKLGKDIIICYWNYDYSDMPETYKNLDAKVLVCPGTNTWKSFFPRYRYALGNFSLMKKRAGEIGACGFMVTDWGDAGHIHPFSVTEDLFRRAFRVFESDMIEENIANSGIDLIISLLDKVHYADYMTASEVKEKPEYITKLLFHDDPFCGTGFSSQTDEQAEELIRRIDELEKFSRNTAFQNEFEKDIKLFVDKTSVLKSRIRLHMLIRHGAEKALIVKSCRIFIVKLRKWFSLFMKNWLDNSQPMGLYFHIHFMKKIEEDILSGMKKYSGKPYKDIPEKRLYDDPEFLNLFSVGSSEALNELWDNYML